MSKAKAECASLTVRNTTWKDIDSSKYERKVRKLQVRIAKAHKEKTRVRRRDLFPDAVGAGQQSFPAPIQADHEFITANAVAVSFFCRRPLQALRHPVDEGVAFGVAEGVVHLFRSFTSTMM